MAAPAPTVNKCKYENQAVSTSTWYIHYEKYLDFVSGKWSDDRADSTQSSHLDFNFDEDNKSSECEMELDNEFYFEDDASVSNGANVGDIARCVCTLLVVFVLHWCWGL